MLTAQSGVQDEGTRAVGYVAYVLCGINHFYYFVYFYTLFIFILIIL